MSTHRDNANELRRRIMTEAGLGLPTPRVSVAVGDLLVDLYTELMGCVLELEITHDIAAKRLAAAEERPGI